jgi:hypothetical protein
VAASPYHHMRSSSVVGSDISTLICRPNHISCDTFSVVFRMRVGPQTVTFRQFVPASPRSVDESRRSLVVDQVAARSTAARSASVSAGDRNVAMPAQAQLASRQIMHCSCHRWHRSLCVLTRVGWAAAHWR